MWCDETCTLWSSPKLIPQFTHEKNVRQIPVRGILKYIYLALLPGKSHGWRNLVGCSPWGHEESDTTERLHFHFSLSCIGEGNGNPLQCSCLENPRDRGAWWVAIYGVAKSWTRLKRLNSSSNVYPYYTLLIEFLKTSNVPNGMWMGKLFSPLQIYSLGNFKTLPFEINVFLHFWVLPVNTEWSVSFRSPR